MLCGVFCLGRFLPNMYTLTIYDIAGIDISYQGYNKEELSFNS